MWRLSEICITNGEMAFTLYDYYVCNMCYPLRNVYDTGYGDYVKAALPIKMPTTLEEDYVRKPRGNPGETQIIRPRAISMED